ncbi:MAG: potassium transporter TrkG [bacterium]
MGTPTYRLLLTFSILILIGTIALQMPGTAHPAHEINWIDSLFTSTSAVCVTGLTVTDTGTSFTLGGQLIILILIQAGGLGMLTISNWIFLTLYRRPVSLEGRMVLEETHGTLTSVEPSALLRRIIRFTAVSEGIGAVVLFFRFLDVHPAPQALWMAVFHSVSAFCNAGFSLYPDSLMGFRDDLVVNLTVMALILVGGIGFVVCTDVTSVIHNLLHKRWKRLASVWARMTLHTKVVLATTGILLLAGTSVVFVFEGHNILRDVPWYRRILPSMFLSFTSRTAGFNTLDTAELTNVTLLTLLFLMAVGASPGSTGGGMKTTTLAIILAMARARVLNRPRIEMFKRSIPGDLVAKAVATAAAFVVLIMISVVALEYIEFGFASHRATQGQVLDLLFEATSALGTVGLSVGVTPTLKPASRLVLVAIMFVGRVGPLAVAGSLIGQRRPLRYSLPEERLIVG